MFQIPLSTRGAALGALALLALSALAACGADDHEASAGAGRPTVTFTATPDALIVPAEVPSGLVDIDLQTEPGGDPSRSDHGHHLVIARLDDGVSLEQAFADDEGFFTMMTIKGGNGTIAAGEQLTMTLDLEPGNYFALDNPQLPDPIVEPFTVVDSGSRGRRPDAEGVVHLGPGMVIHVPEDFDGTGTWEFVNDDESEVHEAAMVRLAAGKTVEDVIAWGEGGMQGEPPIDGEFGSMGALGPGQRAFITVDAPESGDYVMICFVPGRDGIPHLMKGMVSPFTVER